MRLSIKCVRVSGELWDIWILGPCPQTPFPSFITMWLFFGKPISYEWTCFMNMIPQQYLRRLIRTRMTLFPQAEVPPVRERGADAAAARRLGLQL